MPNHVVTHCTVIGSDKDIQEFEDRFIGTQMMDFNRITPMPDSIAKMEESSFAQQAEKFVLYASNKNYAFENPPSNDIVNILNKINDGQNYAFPIYDLANLYLDLHPEAKEIGSKRLKNIAEHGSPSWYQWALKHWGTKWNSYDFKLISETPYEFVFGTAWSFPEPIFKRLAWLFTRLGFDCKCVDEMRTFVGEGWFSYENSCLAMNYRALRDKDAG